MNIFSKIASYFQSRDTKYYKKYYTEIILSKYSSLDQLLKFFNHESNFNKFKTEKVITFKKNLNFGARKKEILQQLGKPLFKYKNPTIKNHSILVYKFSLGSNKTKCEIHLFKNKFFLGLYIFDQDSKNLSLVKNTLTKKYLGKEHNLDDMIIADNMNNFIFINHEIINFIIIYMSLECGIREELIALIEKRKNELKEQKRKLIEKLENDL